MTRLGTAYTPVAWSPPHLTADALALAQHCQWVVVPLSEEALGLHAADWPMLVGALRDAGLEVGLSPWGLPLFGGEPPTSVGHLCPQSCAVQRLFDRWAAAAVGAAPDFVLLDEPHTPRPPCAPAEGEAAIQQFAERIAEAGIALHLYINPARAPLSPQLAAACAVLGLDLYYPANVADRLTLLKATAQQFGVEQCAWLRAFRCGVAEAEAACTAACAAGQAGVERIGVWSWRAGADCGALRSADAEAFWARVVEMARGDGTAQRAAAGW